MANKSGKDKNYQQLSGELDEVMNKLQEADLAPDQAQQIYKTGLELIDQLGASLTETENAVAKLKSSHRMNLG